MNTAPPPVLTARPSSRLAIVRLALLGAALLPQSAHASLFHGETLDAAARISTPSAPERDVDTLRGRSNEHPHASDVLLASVVCRPKVQQSDCAKGCKLNSGYKHDDDNRHGCARMGELRRPPEGPAEFAVYHSAYARLYYRVARWLEGR